jgi:acetyltransferase-like isoleucine patch superfamily enzyme
LRFFDIRKKIKAFLSVETIPLEYWQAVNSRNDHPLSRRLLLRMAIVRLVRSARSIGLMPLTIVRAINALMRLLGELERLHFSQRRQIVCGRACAIDVQTWLVNGKNIRLGHFVKISAFSTVMAGEKASVSIGHNTIVGPGVTIVAFNHGYHLADIPIRYQEWLDTTEQAIVIGKDVWIGANVVILPGSSIGDGSIVAAGSLVKGAVPPCTIIHSLTESQERARFST